MASILRLPPQRQEVERLRTLVEDQHRRLRVYQNETDRGPAAGDVVDEFPTRCEKPRLSAAALARLMAEAEARLALAGSRVGLALRAPWPERRPEMPVLRPAPGLPAYAQAADGPMPNVVFALFGSHGEEQRRAVENVLREQRGAQPFVPIFLTNGSDFSTFREARLVFEYFPFVLDEAVTVPPASWSAYFLEALQLTMRRWGVQRLVRI